MDDSEAQERISALFGLIKGINPHDEKLTNQEKLEEIFGGRDEKTKEALELLNKLIENNEKKGSEWRRSENFLVSIIYTDQIKELEAIKKILEKRSLTDEQGYQEALELDEEDRRVLLKKEEKLEAIKEIIDELEIPYDHAQMANAIQKIDIILGKNN